MSRTWLLSLRPAFRVSPPDSNSVRGIHILHEIFYGDRGNSKEPFQEIKKYVLPPAEDIHLTSVHTDSSRLGDITLKDALPHIKPFTPLARAKAKDGRIRYNIKTSGVPSMTKFKSKFKRAGRSKEFHFTADISPSYALHNIKKCHNFLLGGARVEMTLRPATRSKRTVDWALQNRPDLRPDAILPAMPEGTQMLMFPCAIPEGNKVVEKNSMGFNLHWAMEHEPSLGKVSASLTPKWMKEMLRWDVPLRMDPRQEGKQKQNLKSMYEYSLLEKGRKEKQTAFEKQLNDVDLSKGIFRYQSDESK